MQRPDQSVRRPYAPQLPQSAVRDDRSPPQEQDPQLVARPLSPPLRNRNMGLSIKLPTARIAKKALSTVRTV